MSRVIKSQQYLAIIGQMWLVSGAINRNKLGIAHHIQSLCGMEQQVYLKLLVAETSQPQLEIACMSTSKVTGELNFDEPLSFGFKERGIDDHLGE